MSLSTASLESALVQSRWGKNMVHLIVGATNPNCREHLAAMFRLRHDVFIKEKGWNLKSYNGLEFDQFDTADTMYLLEYNDDGELAATVRMISTMQPTLLSEVFADMCEGGPPKNPQMWELTRGAIARHVRKAKHFGHIECATIEAGLLWGATKACGLFSVDLLMKKMRSGLDAKPLGQPRMIDGEPNVVAEFPLDAEVLRKTRELYRITGPSIERIHLMPQQPKKVAA
jgi:N-acyl-L-homoserine lactone synthetase